MSQYTSGLALSAAVALAAAATSVPALAEEAFESPAPSPTADDKDPPDDDTRDEADVIEGIVGDIGAAFDGAIGLDPVIDLPDPCAEAKLPEECLGIIRLCLVNPP